MQYWNEVSLQIHATLQSDMKTHFADVSSVRNIDFDNSPDLKDLETKTGQQIKDGREYVKQKQKLVYEIQKKEQDRKQYMDNNRVTPEDLTQKEHAISAINTQSTLI